MQSQLTRFRDAVYAPEFRLDEAALLIGDWQVETNVAQGLAQLDAWAMRVGAADLSRLRATLFGADGFTGAGSLDDARHHFLTEVLASRVGIPIALSVVTLEVARRVGLPAFGISFPGRFLVGVGDPSAPTIIDPHHGGAMVTRDGLATLLARVDPGRPWHDALLAKASHRDILQRMLQNLAGLYGRTDDLERSLAVLERLAILLPEHPRIGAQLAALRQRANSVN